MLIVPLDYSTFKSKKIRNTRIGSFKHSDRVWISEVMPNEVAARRKLLSTQLRLLFAGSSQASTTLAAKKNRFYFLTERKGNIQSTLDLPVLSLLDHLLDLSISDAEAINYMRHYYITNRRETGDLHALMNQMLLKMVITPPEVFVSFVRDCISTDQQQMHITALYQRQNILISHLAKENAKFQQFFMSETAGEYMASYYSILERFRINEVMPIFNGLKNNVIEDIYFAQKKKLSENGLLSQDNLLESDTYSGDRGLTSKSDPSMQSTLGLQLPDNSQSEDDIPWSDIGQPPLDTPRTGSSSPSSFSSLMNRFGQLYSRSSSRVSNSTPISTESHSSSRHLMSPVISMFKGLRGSSSQIAIEVPSSTEVLRASETPLQVNEADLEETDLPQISIQLKGQRR